MIETEEQDAGWRSRIGEEDNRCKELTNLGNVLQGYGTWGSRKKWNPKNGCG
jgi:hypothetical protein